MYKDATIIDRREMLQIKLKSLMEEARIIRRTAMRVPAGDLRDELHHHRRGVVRSEARHTHLAYGFIRGRLWSDMELPRKENLPDWKKVEAMIKKYGPTGKALNTLLEALATLAATAKD